jgi:topoisomerase-4 subunit A
LEAVTTHPEPIAIVKSGRGAQARTQKIKIAGFVEVMGWKAVGSKLFDFTKSVEVEWGHKEAEREKPPELF